MDDTNKLDEGSCISNEKAKNTKRRKERNKNKEANISKTRGGTVVPINDSAAIRRHAFENAEAKQLPKEDDDQVTRLGKKGHRLQFADTAGKYLETVHHIENCHYGVHDDKGSYESRRMCEGICGLM